MGSSRRWWLNSDHPLERSKLHRLRGFSGCLVVDEFCLASPLMVSAKALS